jgi:multiple sugar transport system substrate-binding protein
MLCSACNSTPSTAGPKIITLFFHSGQGPEREALNASLQAFSELHPDIQVVPVQLPEGRYTDAVNIAAMAHSLPCLLDFDGPTLYNYAWSGYLIPLDKYVSPEMKADFLPSIPQQGTYNHKRYTGMRQDEIVLHFIRLIASGPGSHSW